MRDHIGEFEELILLIVMNLGEEAYGLNIREYMFKKCQRKANISAIHSALHRLEKKGYLDSSYDRTSIKERGGRPKLIFKITKSGYTVLNNARRIREDLWSTIPNPEVILDHE